MSSLLSFLRALFRRPSAVRDSEFLGYEAYSAATRPLDRLTKRKKTPPSGARKAA